MSQKYIFLGEVEVCMAIFRVAPVTRATINYIYSQLHHRKLSTKVEDKAAGEEEEDGKESNNGKNKVLSQKTLTSLWKELVSVPA